MEHHRFDQAGYWIKRHKDFANDPRSVGNLAYTIEENFKGEVQLKEAVGWVSRGLAERYSSVLDLGCGYGRIANEFILNGFDYLGVDISEEAIRQARIAVPQGIFIRENLVDWGATHRYDVVCALYVFVHFVDDKEWLAVLEGALSRVNRDGILFFADQFPTERSELGPHVVGRPLRDYEAVFKRHGFRIDDDLAKHVVEAMPDIPCTRQFRFATR